MVYNSQQQQQQHNLVKMRYYNKMRMTNTNMMIVSEVSTTKRTTIGFVVATIAFGVLASLHRVEVLETLHLPF